jgi:TRAP transporter TAXI family solute receptor
MGDLYRAAMPRRLCCVLIAAICAVSLWAADSWSVERPRRASPETPESIGTRINSNTVSVVSGNLNGTYLTIAYDLSAVLDDGDNLRVLPIIGKGGGQNIRDVRFLKGVDIGITQSNLLSVFRRSNEIGQIDDKILYIARLFNEELHLVVRAESGITSIEQLAGKKVNFSDVGSGTQLSSRDIFARLGINVTEVNMGQNDAFVALKSGDIAASVLIAGKPTGSTATLKAADGFRILPVAFSKALQDDYLPTTFTHEDYPNLIERGGGVDSIAVGAVLIAYNWPQNTDRYRRIAKFIDAFFPRIAEFQKAPRHPKWREVNLTATVAGTKRFPAADAWLQANQQSLAQPVVKQKFEKFLARNGDGASAAIPEQQREQLFQEFLKWSQRQEAR